LTFLGWPFFDRDAEARERACQAWTDHAAVDHKCLDRPPENLEAHHHAAPIKTKSKTANESVSTAAFIARISRAIEHKMDNLRTRGAREITGNVREIFGTEVAA